MLQRYTRNRRNFSKVRPLIAMQALSLCFLRRFLRRFLSEHNVCPHGVLRPAQYVVTGVEEETVLEHEYTAIFRLHIYSVLHVVRVKCGGAAFERLSTFAVVCVTEVQVQREVRTLLAIWRLVRAVAMLCRD